MDCLVDGLPSWRIDATYNPLPIRVARIINGWLAMERTRLALRAPEEDLGDAIGAVVHSYEVTEGTVENIDWGLDVTRLAYLYEMFLFGIAAFNCAIREMEVADIARLIRAYYPTPPNNLICLVGQVTTRRPPGNIPYRITSIGGGPDTDIFAIIATRSLLFHQPPASFHFDIFDCVLNWRMTLDDLVRNPPAPTGITYTYAPLDLSPSQPISLVLVFLVPYIAYFVEKLTYE
jgi:hypothetical protein